jgi:DNA repair protein RadD
MKYKLRPYQQEASDAAVKFFKSKEQYNALMVLATGAGKSLCIADIAYRLGGKVLILSPSKEILEQNYAKLKSYGVEDIAIYSASCGCKEIARITFATIGSIIRKKDEFKKFKAIIIDECDTVNAKEGMYKEFLTHVKRKVLGLTATPYRLYSQQGKTVNGVFKPMPFKKGQNKYVKGIENKCMEKILTRTVPKMFQKIIYQVPIQTLLEKGYLSRLRYFSMKIMNLENVKRNTTGQDFDDKSLFEEMQRSNYIDQLAGIVDRLLHPKDPTDKRNGILVFTKFTNESEELCKRIPGSAMVSGETPKTEREQILKDFKSGRIKVLANVGILTCLSEDTEILTRNKGWVGMNDIEESDSVAQYDCNNEKISFACPLRIIRKEHSENFVTIEGRYMNFKVTHDHNMLYRKAGRHGKLGVWHKCEAKDLVSVARLYVPISGYADIEEIEVEQEKRCSDSRFIATNSYNYRKRGMSYQASIDLAKSMLQLRNARQYKSPSELTLDECRFIGFWLGDGTYYHKGRKAGRRYSITQSVVNPKMIEWIRDILKKCDIHYNEYYGKAGGNSVILGRLCNVHDHITFNLANGTGGNGQNVNSGLYGLRPYLKKDGTDLFWGLNRKQFFCLMEGYFKANGYHGDNKEYTGQTMCGANKKLFDLMQAIGACRGYRITLSHVKDRAYTKTPLYRISLADFRYHQIVNERPIEVKNADPQKVWCVTMPQGTIVTRRNGRVTIMGNCGFDFPALDTIVFARPTMSLRVWYQSVGRIIRPYEGKRGWVIDLGGNVERFGEVENLQLVNDDKGLPAYIGYVGGEWKYLTGVYY